ncbi:MAG: hemerythrin family protein [Rhodospirillaceae bacterium]
MANDLLVFDNDMLLGIQSLDDQHKEFYLIYNTLVMDIATRGREPVDLGPVVRDLYAYFINHFQLEELIMRHIDYPFLREHKKAHRDMFASLDDLTIRLSQRAITLEEVLLTLRATACVHFRDVDHGIGIHYRVWLRSHPEGAPMGSWGG